MQHSPTMTLADAIFPRIQTENRINVWARDIALIIAGAILVTLCAQIAIRVPWTTVPITGQTFASLVVGASLGAWRGIGALSLYTFVGMFALPVFTPANSVTTGSWDAHFILPWAGNEALLWNITSGGYIVGFIIAAGLVGFLAERRLDRGAWVQATMLLGTVAIWIPGLLWLGYLIGTDWVAPGGTTPISELIAGSDTLDKTLKGGLYPFVVGDLMKLMLAAMVLPGAWWLVDKLKRD